MEKPKLQTDLLSRRLLRPHRKRGSSEPSQGRAGQAIPVKWQVKDAKGETVADPASFAGITSYPVSCTALGTALSDVVEEPTAGSSGLQYLGDGYWQYNWKSPKEYVNQCRAMVLSLKGGYKASASFKFVK